MTWLMRRPPCGRMCRNVTRMSERMCLVEVLAGRCPLPPPRKTRRTKPPHAMSNPAMPYLTRHRCYAGRRVQQMDAQKERARFLSLLVSLH